jgi:glycosyltransferase involved in cell wall biosynthesis
MRITLVTETYFPQVNGVSRTLGSLVETTVKSGHQVQLIIPRYPDPVKGSNGVQVVDFPGLALPFYREILLPVVPSGKLGRILRDFDPDVIHIATEGTLGLSALKAARRLQVPVVSSYHTNFPQYLKHYRMGWLEPGSRGYLRWFHNRTGCTLVPTREMSDRLIKNGFYNVDVWSRGIDTRMFNPSRRDPDLRKMMGVEEGDTAFLYVGRLAPEKNLMMMIKAFDSLSGSVPVKLILVGDGPYRRELEKKGDPRMFLAGYRYGKELAALYASSDIFVFPSLTDTFGNVMQEAMACGLPVIAFDITGPRSVVRNFETGLLAGDVSEESLSTAMERVAANGDLRHVLAEGALEFARTREWDRVNSVCLKWYEKLAEFRG